MTHFRDTILIQLSFANPSHTWGPPPPLWGRVKQDGGPFSNKYPALTEIFTLLYCFWPMFQRGVNLMKISINAIIIG